jgi:hypothetical protein
MMLWSKANMVFLKLEMFAMTEMAYVTARMVQIFRQMESKDNREWRERFGVNLSSENGVKVALTRREK